MARSPRRSATSALVVLATLLAGGCAGQPPAAPSTIAIRVVWTEPPPGPEPRMGGFAFFARVSGPDGPGEEQEVRDGLTVVVPTEGRHVIEALVRHESDAVAIEEVPGGTPRTVRTFGAIDSTCSIDVDVRSGEALAVRMMATPGACEIVQDDDPLPT